MAQTNDQSGSRCECALTFENGAAFYEHAVQTGHMKSRTCFTCRKVFVNKLALENHQKSSYRHKTTQENQAPTTTTPHNGQKSITTKAKVTPKPTPTETGSTSASQGAKRAKKDGDSTRPKAAIQGPAVNIPLQSTTAAQEANHSTVIPSDAQMSRRARKRRNKANMIEALNNRPVTPTAASKNTTGRASVTTTAAKASGPSTSGSNDLPESDTKENTMPNPIGSFILEKDIAHLKPKSDAKEIPVAHLVRAYILESDIAHLKRTFSTQVDESPEPLKQGRGNGKAPKQVAANTAPVKAAMPSGSQSQQPHGQSNPYSSWVSPHQNPPTFASLTKLCHGTKRLRSEQFIIPGSANSSALTWRYITAPPRTSRVPKRLAVALDCEMVEVVSHRSEVARLCAVDMVTGEVLIDSLVEPTERVRDWRTRYSGVTPAAMSAAVAAGNALRGWPAARALLFEHVNQDTILCGHALQNDFRALGIAHARVVDSALVTAQAAFPAGNSSNNTLKRRWKLKTLARELLGLGIQDSPRGHDCVEDTLAAREVLLWCVKRPRELAAWGASAGAAFERENNERVEKQRKLAREQREKREREEAAAAAAAGVDAAPRVLGEDFDWDHQSDRTTWEDILRGDAAPEGYILYGHV